MAGWTCGMSNIVAIFASRTLPYIDISINRYEQRKYVSLMGKSHISVNCIFLKKPHILPTPESP